MAPTQTAREFYQYCDAHEFIPEAILNDFKRRLEQEDNLVAFSVGLEKFQTDICPQCSAAGAYKWHFLGKLQHPECGWSWYVSPGTYMGEQFGSVFKTGMEFGAGIYSDSEKKGEKGAGCIGAIFGFVIGLSFRLPFAIVMSFIQSIVYLAQKKPEPTTQKN